MHSVLRWLLAPLSVAYAGAVSVRNWAFDTGRLRAVRVEVPVVSIGNLTVGGTGKTPMVIEIVQRLAEMGRRPAVLTRGYRAQAGREADEVVELRDALPETPVVVDHDRVAGAAEAVRSHQADCLVLDDGFQHRRIARDLDVVLIDALDPWGGGWVLPAGRLREPPAGLRRAGLVVITRANQVDARTLREIEGRAAEIAPEIEIAWAVVEPTGVVHLDAGSVPVADLAFHHVLPVCGIGNPQTFLCVVETGAGCVGRPLLFGDHYAYRAADVARIVACARQEGADLVLTTRKDWGKLAPLWPHENAPGLARLDVRLRLDDPDGVVDAALAALFEAPTAPDAATLRAAQRRPR